MALIINDRVKETSSSTGKGPIVVSGAAVGYQTLSSTLGEGNTTPYAIEAVGGADWEVGLGQYFTSNSSLIRLQVLTSSNNNNLVNFTTGTKNVFITVPAAYTALRTNGLNQFSNTTSANLASIIPDKTGTGSLVFSNNAILVTPNIGNATGANLSLSGDLSVTGNLIVSGVSTFTANTLTVYDPLIYIGESYHGNFVDIGFVSHFDNGTYQHTGLVRDHTDGIWKLFEGLPSEPANNDIDFNSASPADLSVKNLYCTAIPVGGTLTIGTGLGSIDFTNSVITNFNASGLTIANTQITGLLKNSQIQNNSVTIVSGFGLANGGTVALGSNITLNANTGTLAQTGIVMLTDSINSTSNALAATANSVKVTYDLANSAFYSANNASALTTGTVPNARLVSIPNSSLQNTSVTVTSGFGLTNGGTVALGSSITLSANTGTTAQTGIVQLNDTVTSVLTSQAATANSVKTAYDLANLAFASANNASALTTGTIPNARLVSVPNSSLQNTSVTVTSGFGLTNGGTVALGSSITLSSNTGTTAQTGIVQLNDTVTSTSTALAATANSVTATYNLANNAFNSSSNASSLTTGTLPNARLVSVPNSSLQNTSVTVTSGFGLTNGGTVSLGSSITLSSNTGTTAQTGIVQLNDNFTSTSTALAATANTVTATYNLANNAFNSANNASALTTGTIPNARLVSVPNSSLQNTSVTVTAGFGLTNGGSVALGSNITLSSNTGTTAQTGIVQLNDTVTSTSTALAATANSVTAVYNLANNALNSSSNASTLTTGTLPNARLVSVPNSSLQNTSVTVTAGFGLTNGGTVALGSNITLSSNTGTTAQTGIVQLNDNFTSTSTALAATANTVTAAYTLATNAFNSANNASALTTGTVPNARLVSIPNSSLANSTISGAQLGSNISTLTIGTGLSGTSFNGTSGVTIAIDSTVATLNGSQTLSNKTINAASFTGITAFSNTTDSTAINNGSVIYSGGVGIAKNVYVGGDLSVSGNVYMSGNVISLNANTLNVNDSIIYIAQDNPANLLDIGIVGHFTSTQYQHTGLVRDATDGVWKLFSNVSSEPTTTIDFTTAIYDQLQVGSVIGNLYGNANTATILQTARSIGDVSFNGSANVTPERINYKDTRAVDFVPLTYPGTTLHLKTNTTDGLSDGGTYHGSLHLQQWTDASGGAPHQLAFTDNGNIHLRTANGANSMLSWLPWYKIIHNGQTSTVTNSLLQNTSVTIVAGSGLTNGGSVALGSNITLSANTGTTAQTGIVQLNDTVTSTSTALAATANSVKTAYDLASTASLASSNASTLTTGTLPNARLVSVPNSSLQNTSITIGTTSIALGSSNTILAGLTSVTSTGFTGTLTGNANTATKLITARLINGVSFDGSADITVADSTKLPLTGGTLSSGISIYSAGNPGFEMGRNDGVASTPYIDFHSGATFIDYDSRIIANGGNGVTGQGGLSFYANTITIPAGTVSSNTTTGALVVTGGLGVGGSLYTGGLNVTGTATANMFYSSNGTATSLTTGAAWFSGGGGAILFDDNAHKRISWNDGAGNFNIRAGNYFNGTSTVYVKGTGDANSGAASIIMACDGADGAMSLSVAPIGIPGANVSYTNSLVVGTTQVAISAATASTSYASGAFVVSGGAGIAGAVNAGGNITSYQSDTSAAVIITNTTSTAARYPQFAIYNYNNGFGGYPVIELFSSRGNVASPTAVQTGDILGGFDTWGRGTSASISATRINGVAEANFTTIGQAGIDFKVTDSTGTQATGMYLSGSGNLTVDGYVSAILGGVGQLQAISGSGSTWWNSMLRNDGANVYLLSSNVQTTQVLATNATWNSFRPFSWSLTTGAVSICSDGAQTNFGGSINVRDNNYVYVGTGNDLYLIHDGVNSSITNQTGNTTISVNSGGLTLQSFGTTGSNFELWQSASYLDANTSYFRSGDGLSQYGQFNNLGLYAQNSADWPIRTLSSSATNTSRGGYLQQRSISGGSVTSGTVLGGLSAGGHNGTTLTAGWNGGGELLFTTTEAWGSAPNGTKFTLNLSPNGANTVINRLTIDQNGATTINGDLTANTFNLSNGIFGSNTFTTSTTAANQVVDTISATAYRTVKYITQITSSTSYQSSEIFAIHNGTTVTFTENNILNVGSSLGTFDMDISGGAIRLLFSPVNAVNTVRIIKTGVVI